MPSRVNIYNPQGRKLTELEVDFYREWKISEYGAGKFDISVLDSKFQKNNVDYGNWVYVEHDKLPDWVGTIETPREWNNGMVTVNCKSGEARLQRALTRPADKWEGSPGAIFQEIVNSVGKSIIGLIVGRIYTGGDSSIKFSEPYMSIYDCAEKLAKYHEHEWNVEPVIDPTGALKFSCNWAHKLGSKRREVKLYEDKHITKLVEQGDMTNVCFTHGTGSNFKPDLVGEYSDQASISDYGIAELLVSDGAINKRNNQRMAQTYVEEHKNPRRTFTLALEDNGNLFSAVHIGDRFPVETYTMGFTGYYIGMKTELRVLQMNYKDSENVLNVVADEVTDG